MGDATGHSRVHAFSIPWSTWRFRRPCRLEVSGDLLLTAMRRCAHVRLICGSASTLQSGVQLSTRAAACLMAEPACQDDVTRFFIRVRAW